MAEIKWNKLAVEFLGVFLLTLTVVSLIVTRAPTAFVGIAIAFTVMVLVYSGGDVSGGHYNPAITLGCWMMGLISSAEAGQYAGAQFLGGYLGALSGFSSYGIAFSVDPASGYSWWSVFACEALYTMWLVFTVLASINVPSLLKGGAIGNQYYGLNIGFAILTGAASIGGITGGYMNPAIALGVDLSSMFSGGFGNSLWYIGFELLGAAAASQLYKVTWSDKLGSKVISPNAAKLLCEFFGVFWLTMSAGLIVSGGAKVSAFAIAAVLATIVYNFGPVSGAHVNPAVTAAILVSGRNKISGSDALQYIGWQLSGGVVGGAAFTLISGGKSFPLAPAAGANLFGVWAAEIIFTFVLCLTVLACATAAKINADMFGFLIGMCVTVGGFSASAMSGGCLNPAVGLGFFTTDGFQKGFSTDGLGYWSQYAAAELVGASAAGGAFISTYVSEYDALKAK